VRIFVEIEHIINRGSHFGPKESDGYFPCYGAVMSLVTNLVKFHDHSIAWEISIRFFWTKMWPSGLWHFLSPQMFSRWIVEIYLRDENDNGCYLWKLSVQAECVRYCIQTCQTQSNICTASEPTTSAPLFQSDALVVSPRPVFCFLVHALNLVLHRYFLFTFHRF